jgi:sugar phosphate isomerase/epimerase
VEAHAITPDGSQGRGVKLGLTTESFCTAIQGGRMNLQKIIDFAGQNNFEGLEIINHRDVWRKDIGDDVKMNLARMRERKLRYYSYGVREDLLLVDEHMRWRAINKIREAILLASITNVPNVCLMGTGIRTEHGASIQDWNEAYPVLFATLQDCLELAERKRITLCLANGGTVLNGSTRLLGLLQALKSQYIKITFDVAAFLVVDEEPADAVRTLSDDIRSSDAHLANQWTTLQGRQLAPCALGEGIVPQREVLYTLKQVGFDGFLCVLYQGEEEPAVGVERSVTYLKTMLREVRSV